MEDALDAIFNESKTKNYLRKGKSHKSPNSIKKTSLKRKNAQS